MGKSIIGMMGRGASSFAPASSAVALSSWVQVVGGSAFEAAYQPFAANELAYPGNQAMVDLVVDEGLRPEATLGPPGYTYNRTHFQDQLDWEATYAGTFDNPVFNVPYNERIDPVTLTIYKNDVATDLVIVVGRLETGTVKGTGTLTFVSGDTIRGKLTSPIQDTNDPEYVGETIQIASFAMTLEVADVVKLPYRTALHSGNIDTVVGSDFTSADDWDVTGPPITADSSDHYAGHRINTQDGALISLQVDEGVLDDNYGAMPMVCFQDGGLAGREVSADSSLSESEVRRVAQMKVRAPGTFSDMRFYVWCGNWLTSEAVGIAPTMKYDARLEVDGTAEVTKEVGLLDEGTLAMTGTYAAADGELLNFAVKKQATPETGAIGAGEFLNFRAEFESVDDWFDIHAQNTPSASGDTAANYTSGAITVASEVYLTMVGGFADNQAAAMAAFREYLEFTIAEGMTYKRLRCQVGVLSGGTVRLGLMADGVKLTQVVDITATGWSEDTTHTDTVNTDGIGSTANIVYYLEVLTGTPVIRFDSIEITAKVVAQTGASVCDQDCPDGLSFMSLQERTLRMLGEDPDNPVYWTAAEIGRLVNDAYTVACRESKFLQHIEQVTLVEDQAEYALADLTGQILRVTFGDRALQNITKYEHDRCLPDWEADIGYIDRYITTLQDKRKILTYKAWDGTGEESHWPFGGTIGGVTAGAAGYTVWDAATSYDAGDIVSNAGSFWEALDFFEGGLGDEEFYEPGVGSSYQDFWVEVAEPAAAADTHAAYLNVWSVKNPALMSDDCDEPELPPWSHLGLCFAAAAKALRKYGEHRNEALAGVYEAMALGYLKALKSHAANRTPERLVAMGRGVRRGLRRPMPYDQEIVD